MCIIKCVIKSLNVISRAGLEIIAQHFAYIQSRSVRKSLLNLPANYHAENYFRISNLSEIISRPAPMPNYLCLLVSTEYPELYALEITKIFSLISRAPLHRNSSGIGLS